MGMVKSVESLLGHKRKGSVPAWWLVLYSMMLGLEERCCLHCNANKGILQPGKYWGLAYLMTFCLAIWKGKSSAECERKCPGGLVSWRMVCIWNNSAQGKHWFWESEGDSVYTMDSFFTNFTFLLFGHTIWLVGSWFLDQVLECGVLVTRPQGNSLIFH